MKKNASITFRLTEDMKSLLTDISFAENRSIAQQAELFVMAGAYLTLLKNSELSDKYSSLFDHLEKISVIKNITST